MADSIPPVASQPTADVAYRPVSGLAVAGFTVGLLYALIIAVTTMLALARGEPFFLASFMVVVPVVGAVLSYLGQRHVQNSEGTRVGAGLARWGLFLSVFVGLGYFAYSAFTGMALAKQASDFLMVKADDESGFFPRLVEAARDPVELNAAFLLTLPAIDRENLAKDDEKTLRLLRDQPSKDGGPGNLSRFKTDKLVRTIMQGGVDGAEIESLGLQRWYHDAGAYHVLRRYQVNTPEVNLTVVVPAETSRDRKGERKWYVNFPAIEYEAETMTPFGQKMFKVRQNAHLWLKSVWFPSLLSDPVAGFDKLDGANWSAVIQSDELREKVRHSVKELFTGTRPNRFAEMQIDVRPRFAPWRRIAGKLQLHQEFATPLVLANGDRYMIAGDFVVESRDQVDPHNPPANLDWQVKRINVTSVGAIVSRPP